MKNYVPDTKHIQSGSWPLQIFSSFQARCAVEVEIFSVDVQMALCNVVLSRKKLVTTKPFSHCIATAICVVVPHMQKQNAYNQEVYREKEL
jgi:hypothetical protein